ncbi:hypothetical protein JWS13_04330 (plasmid) [Rhodococcus pseudokoreensis]|uniref:MinD-like ATPase involved in chromosome partitioning or flagellar assembly n=1 Tax=Rhodococcus pseudokoreensis TaxID=2811421 RepID=A0A974ZS18_9NOCA|nr:hypothetical protein [Rhodococcus pseudokoreensis]QSE87942.1 hypothetical protein JWS13_04330 [Rhodococcus pseudokoreensis]
MTDSIYPAEPPVDLRSARKITPPPPAAEPEFENPHADEPEVWAPAAGSEPEGSDQDYVWDEGDSDNQQELAPAVAAPAWHEELLPTPPNAETDPARWGRRGWFNTVSGGALKLRPRPEEVLHRRGVAAVGRPLIGDQLIMVANPDGGQAKTVSALMLGNTFATYRRSGPPVVWDNNESEGTLGLRAASAVPATSVWDLLASFGDLAAPHAAASGLSQFLRPQPTGAEVLASDDSADRFDEIEGEDCEKIYSVLRRWRDLVIVDTGNNRRCESWVWTARNAHVLVIPIVYALDATVAVLKMVESLKRLGLEDLVANAIVVGTPNSAGPDPELHDQIHEILSKVGIRNFTDVPFEPAFPRGGRIDYDRLSEETRRAWVRVTAMTATVLAESAHHGTTASTTGDRPATGPLVRDQEQRTGRPARFAELDRHLDRHVEQVYRGPDHGERRHLA